MRKSVLAAVVATLALAGCKGGEGSAGQQGTQGPQGSPGAAGAKGLNWRGAWSAATTYAADDAVESGGSAYVAVSPTTGVAPLAPDWTLLASRGADGVQGAQGAQGAQGPQGIQGVPGAAGAAGQQGPQGPAGGPLLSVVDANGASLGAAYYFSGFTVALREVFTGGTALVFRGLVDGAITDNATLYFDAASCGGNAFTEAVSGAGATVGSAPASPVAFLNGTNLYQVMAGTLQNATSALVSQRPAGGACAPFVLGGATLPVFQVRLLGPNATHPAPLTVLTP